MRYKCVIALTVLGGFLYQFVPSGSDVEDNHDILSHEEASLFSKSTKSAHYLRAQSHKLQLDNHQNNWSGTDVLVSLQRENALKNYIRMHPLPPSTAGSDMDGTLVFSAEGVLKEDLNLREFFEQMLTIQGDWDAGNIRSWIAGYASVAVENLANPNHAASQIMQSYDEYLAYLEKVGNIVPSPADNTSLLQQFEYSLETLAQVREDHFGEKKAFAYFQDEESYNHSQYERAKIIATTTEGTIERELQLALWEDSITDVGYRQRLKNKGIYNSGTALVSELRQTGASKASIHSARTDHFGEQVAVRLAALDQRRALWNKKIDDLDVFQQETHHAGLSTTEQDRQLKLYVYKHFNETERRRLPYVF